jgi:hypothetical protein
MFVPSVKLVSRLLWLKHFDLLISVYVVSPKHAYKTLVRSFLSTRPVGLQRLLLTHSAYLVIPQPELVDKLVLELLLMVLLSAR